MKITKKILVAVILPFILSMTVGLVVIVSIFYINIREQKTEYNKEAVQKVTEHVEEVENSFYETALSLSVFKETYEVISKSKSSDIVLKHVFHNLKINLVCFYDSQGNCNAGKYFNIENNEYETFSDGTHFSEFIFSENSTGYINVSNITYIVAKVPYLAGDSEYIMLVGRKLDNNYFNELDSITHGRTLVKKYSDLPEVKEDKAILPLTKGEITEDTLVIQIDFVNISSDDTMMQLYITIALFIIVMTLILIMLLWFVVKYINKPILALTNKIKGITPDSIESQRINTTENNEFTELSKTIDNLLDIITAGREENARIQNELLSDISKRVVIEERLKRRESELILILDSAAEGIFGFDLMNKCTFCNKSCLRLLGYDSDSELLGKNINEIIKGYDSTLEGFETGMFIKRNCSVFDTEYYSYPQIVEGYTVGKVITFFDITERKKMEDMLKESERSKDMLLSNLIGMAYRCKNDDDWTMVFVSDGCYELTGYTSEYLLYNKNISFNELITPEDRGYLREQWKKLLPQRGVLKEEYRINTATGEEKWVLEQGRGVYNEDGEVIALEGLIVDISAQKKRENEIQYLSYHDNLTGVYNRIFFDKEKERFEREGMHPISVIVGDIDGLKFINDAFGHAVGDELIAKTASILKECCKPDSVIARVGGDEFNILLPNTTGEEAYAILKSMQKKIAEFSAKNENIYRFTVSLGYSTKNKVDDDFNEVIKHADDYMYKRKLLEHQSSHSTIVASIRETMNARSIETDKHCERLAEMSRMIAKPLKLSEKDMDELELLSSLHDIGKVGINDTILKKPGPLNTEEMTEMQRHPLIGYRIAMATADLKSIAIYILTHHERWDGLGYPQGLKGKEIPLLSRILAVLDSYDAMTNNRMYRVALSKEEALLEIEKNAGTQFDPAIAKVFIEWMEKSEVY